jgi:hypothetical protein
MVSTNAAKREALLIGVTMLPKFVRIEDAIVRMQFLDLDTNVGCFTFQEQLAPDSIGGVKGLLGRMEDPTTSMINVDRAANIPMTRRAVARRGNDASRNR